MVKVRMNTADVAAELKCLRKLIGMRCSNVYDLSPKTYMFKLMNSSGITESGESEKVLLLMESGVRLHTTAYVRDKSTTPSGFTLKLRKHIRTRRLEDVRQLGYDRIVLFQFGLGANAHNVILELYAQGNIILADSEFTVMTLLRSHRDDDKGFAIMSRHRYPIEACRIFEKTTTTKLQTALKSLVTPANELVELDERGNTASGSSKEKQGGQENIYDEFCPILLNQFKSREFVKFETFDAALDEFYSKIESQRVEQQHKAKESSAMQKLSKIRFDQENRVHTLKKEVDLCTKMAQLIEYNLEDVEAAILAVRVAVANGMSWEDLALMVKEEKKSGNPIAGLIDKLYLEKNCMTLLLSNNLDEMDDDEKTLPADKVEVDLALSAHANARRWYELKKKQENKQEKTITAHTKAFKAAERKTHLQLLQEKSVAAISHMRKVHWFEKFNWFVSSENYLVISGRDAQQNEMIVKRYMSKGDLYVHADLHGASSTVIKNHKTENPIPPLTLNQAGCFTVCHSQAWDSKIVTSAWWVYPHQVSKTAPTGEYLTVGSFMVRGKKNFLPPHPLIMGFGMLFRLDESSLGSHLNERRTRGEEEGMNDIEENGSFSENYDSESEKEIVGEELANMSKEINYLSDLSTDHNKVSLDGLYEVSSVNKLKDFEVNEDSVEDRNSNLNGENVSDTATENVPSISPQLEDLIDRALGLGSSNVAGKNYGLETSQADATQDHHHEERKAALREKPYMSKAERRKLKKGQIDGTADLNVEHEREEFKENNLSGREPDKNVTNLKPDGGKISRGQKGKLKKMKEKYADQDEEERKIRMALLAPAGKVLKNDKESSFDGNAVIDKGNVSVTGLDVASKICYKCKKAGHLSQDCQENPDETSHAIAGGPRDFQNAATGNSSEMDRVPMEEDGIHEIGEEEKGKLNDLDYLTGNPLVNDILLYAVPVCGPYSALQTYKYRVKITPGTVKKGKAAKTAMNLFSHMPEATNREKALMKVCTDPELVAAIIGNVKITAAGLTQLKQKQKKGKKANKEQS